MPYGTLIVGVGSLLGGAASLYGASSVSSAYDSAADLQGAAYADTRNNLSTYQNYGTTSFSRLADYYGTGPDTTSSTYGSYLEPISKTVGNPPSPNDQSNLTGFYSSPGYTYAVQKGTDAVQNSASGKTGALSGNALKAIGEDTASYASQDYWNYYKALLQNYYDRYNDIANSRSTTISGLEWLGGSGQNAATNLGGYSQSTASNIGSAKIGSASSTSSGLSSGIQSLTKGLGSLYDYYLGNYSTGYYGTDYNNNYQSSSYGGDYGGGGTY